MKILLSLLLTALALSLSGCTSWQGAGGNRSAMPDVRVASDGASFVLSDSGQQFRPWGFNYDRDYKMRLIEDYWENEWETVVEDFREMKRLGANVVRIHLQFGKFMSGPATLEEGSFEQLSKLLELAEATGIYLDLTGLACYRKSDVPAWYNTLDEAGRWNAQAAFWRAIARTCSKSPAIFCYNLMNEPVVPGMERRPGDWLLGHLAGFWYVQAITLDPAGRDRAEIARSWIDRLVYEIRAEDQQHMVTVGLLPNSLEDPVSGSGFVPSKVAASLDFISVHIYPNKESIEKDLRTLAGFQVGKPLVVEEIFPLNCNVKILEEFMRRSNRHVSGWIGFYWGQTLEDLSRDKEISALLVRDWLEFFREGPIKSP